MKEKPPRLLAEDLNKIDVLVDRKGSRAQKDAWRRVAHWMAWKIDEEIKRRR